MRREPEECDIIYTTFLLGFAYCLIRGLPFQAMLVYAIALSLKVQAIFLAPFFIYLLRGSRVRIEA